MPQDVRELGRRVKAKYPGKYDDLADDDVGRRVKAKYPGAYDDFTDAPPPTPRSPGLVSNLITGFAQAGGDISEQALALSEAFGKASLGDFGPLKEMGELAGRGALKLVSAFDPAGNAYEAERAIQDPRIAELTAQRRQRAAQSPLPRAVQEFNQRLAAEAALDPSLSGAIARGGARLAGNILPAAATAGAGGIPAELATTALQSAGQPENLAFNLLSVPALGAAGAAVGQIARPILSRIRGAVSAAERIESAAAKATTEGTGPAAVQGASTTVTQPVDALQSAFAKLGTENADDISAMIFNANRRFNSPKSITPEERAAAIEDFNKVVKLTPDEEHALAQVLPEYSYNPVNAGYTGAGRYERQISDIPNAEPNAQLDANLRQLSQFFGSEGRATAPGIAAETGPPVISEAPAMSVGASAARGPSASVSGPSVSAPMDLSVAIAEAAETVPASLGNRIKDELAAIYHLPKTLKSSIDISAPFRQGSLLTIPPSQWGRAARAGVRMFQAFSTKKYNQIVDAIANHVDAPI